MGRRWPGLPAHRLRSRQHRGWKQNHQRYVRSKSSVTTKASPSQEVALLPWGQAGSRTSLRLCKRAE